MKIVKALPTEGYCFKFLIAAFSSMGFKKMKTGEFDRSQICQLIRDEQLKITMLELEKKALSSFKSTIKDFLGKTRSTKCTKVCLEILVLLQNVWIQHVSICLDTTSRCIFYIITLSTSRTILVPSVMNKKNSYTKI